MGLFGGGFREPRMVKISKGEFMMGSPEDEPGRRSNEGPQHLVKIKYRFEVGKYPVTFAEWDAAAKKGACDGDSEPQPEPPLTDPNGSEFTFAAPGDLAAGSGNGFPNGTVYLPGMRFPLEKAPAFPNSQVYGVGGLRQPPGSSGGQCASANYSYPWRDNYCERRSWSMPLCPEGAGHQGQDIRPASCQKSVHWAVAAEEGQITAIGSYSVSLMGVSGTIHRYLHMDMSQLAFVSLLVKDRLNTTAQRSFSQLPLPCTS